METTPFQGSAAPSTTAPAGFPPDGVFYPPGMEPPAPRPEPEPASAPADEVATEDVVTEPAPAQDAVPVAAPEPAQYVETPAPVESVAQVASAALAQTVEAPAPVATAAPVETVAPQPAAPIEAAQPVEQVIPRHAAPDVAVTPEPADTTDDDAESLMPLLDFELTEHQPAETDAPTEEVAPATAVAAPLTPEVVVTEPATAELDNADAVVAESVASEPVAALPEPVDEPAVEQPAPAPTAVVAGLAFAEPEAADEVETLDPLLGLPHAENPIRQDVLEVELLPEPVLPPPGHGRASTETQLEEDDFSLAQALGEMLDRGASDLHLTAGSEPTLRMAGSLVRMDGYAKLTPQVLQRVLYAALTQTQREKFEEDLELDFAYQLPGRGRFRVNMYKQRDSLGAAFRVIPFEIRSLESLGIPPAVSNFAGLPRGFVLVTGPTGSGKSTTLASLIDLANRTRQDHIMTVEDPIEFLHKHKSCLINQREVGEDTWSFSNALKHVLRQDPDIILVGEMRDLETISVALTAAETGHLVFATLHTQDAAQTIDRVIDVFPPHQQQQVRAQLAMSLQGVVCQTLAKTPDGRGRAVATEVLVVTPAVRNLIREGKTHQIYSVMQAGAQHGMHTMDQHLAELVRTRKITYEVGLEKCHHIEDFNRLCGRA